MELLNLPLILKFTMNELVDLSAQELLAGVRVKLRRGFFSPHTSIPSMFICEHKLVSYCLECQYIYSSTLLRSGNRQLLPPSRLEVV